MKVRFKMGILQIVLLLVVITSSIILGLSCCSMSDGVALHMIECEKEFNYLVEGNTYSKEELTAKLFRYKIAREEIKKNNSSKEILDSLNRLIDELSKHLPHAEAKETGGISGKE